MVQLGLLQLVLHMLDLVVAVVQVDRAKIHHAGRLLMVVLDLVGKRTVQQMLTKNINNKLMAVVDDQRKAAAAVAVL